MMHVEHSSSVTTFSTGTDLKPNILLNGIQEREVNSGMRTNARMCCSVLQTLRQVPMPTAERL